MIRDPSDGSVREAPKSDVQISTTKPALDLGIPTSGLPTGSTKEKNIARLEKSRQWLKDYQEKQRNARGSNEQEHSTDGHSSEQGRQT